MAERIEFEHTPSQVADDFKLVDGIGPAVEKRLRAAGVQTFAQLARLKPDQLAELMEGMIGYSIKRIEDQDWTGQALELARQGGQPISEESYESLNNGFHYASFTLELLLDRDNRVRSTRAIHVQTRQEARWAGWDPDRLQSFLVDSSELQLTEAKEALPVEDVQVSEVALSPSENIAISRPAEGLRGTTRIVETRLRDQSGQEIGMLIPGNTPFEIQLLLDLSQVQVPEGEQLSYDATIYMKRMGKSGQDIIGGKVGTLSVDMNNVIDVSSMPLDPGDYQLEAMVSLRPTSQPNNLRYQLAAMTESVPLHVF
jgi:hypothetical protein